MKISILLPYKENFSPIYPGAVSLFINDTTKLSKYKKNITIYGNTDLKILFKLNYLNIPLKKKILSSRSERYVKEFLNIEKKNPSDLIEIHNRPNYLKLLIKNLSKRTFTLYFRRFRDKFLRNYLRKYKFFGKFWIFPPKGKNK